MVGVCKDSATQHIMMSEEERFHLINRKLLECAVNTHRLPLGLP